MQGVARVTIVTQPTYPFLGDHAFLCGYSILLPSSVVKHAAERIICHSSYLIYSEK